MDRSGQAKAADQNIADHLRGQIQINGSELNARRWHITIQFKPSVVKVLYCFTAAKCRLSAIFVAMPLLHRCCCVVALIVVTIRRIARRWLMAGEGSRFSHSQLASSLPYRTAMMRIEPVMEWILQLYF